MLVTSGSSYKSRLVVYVSLRSQTLYIVRLYMAFRWSADNPVFAKHHGRHVEAAIAASIFADFANMDAAGWWVVFTFIFDRLPYGTYDLWYKYLAIVIRISKHYFSSAITAIC